MKSRSYLILCVLLFVSLLASACSSAASSSSNTAGAAGSSSSTTQSQNQPANAALSPATKLALGTLKLEETDQAVTTDQAATLVTLWQAYQALSNSDTTAQVELDAIIKQIQAAMTPEQTKAIDSMQLTRQSMNEILQSLGLDMGGPAGAQATPAAGQSSSSRSGNTNTFPSGGQGAGGPPAGGGPSGGFQVGGPGDMGGGLPPDAAGGTGSLQATPNSTQQARMSAQANQVSPMVLNALIKVLQTKAQPAQ